MPPSISLLFPICGHFPKYFSSILESWAFPSKTCSKLTLKQGRRSTASFSAWMCLRTSCTTFPSLAFMPYSRCATAHHISESAMLFLAQSYQNPLASLSEYCIKDSKAAHLNPSPSRCPRTCPSCPHGNQNCVCHLHTTIYLHGEPTGFFQM